MTGIRHFSARLCVYSAPSAVQNLLTQRPQRTRRVSQRDVLILNTHEFFFILGWSLQHDLFELLVKI